MIIRLFWKLIFISIVTLCSGQSSPLETDFSEIKIFANSNGDSFFDSHIEHIKKAVFHLEQGDTVKTIDNLKLALENTSPRNVKSYRMYTGYTEAQFLLFALSYNLYGRVERKFSLSWVTPSKLKNQEVAKEILNAGIINAIRRDGYEGYFVNDSRSFLKIKFCQENLIDKKIWQCIRCNAITISLIQHYCYK